MTTPLAVASYFGHFEVTHFLIAESGAVLSAPDTGGYTPTHWAAYHCTGIYKRELKKSFLKPDAVRLRRTNTASQRPSRGRIKVFEEVNESEDKQGENRDEKVTMFFPFYHPWRPNSR
jgi:hypothetical protein